MAHQQLSDRVAQQILHSTPDAVLLCDARGRVIFANERAAAMSGYTVDELEGLFVEALIPSGAVDHHERLRARFMEVQLSRPMAPSSSIKLLCRDGSVVAVAVALTTLIDDGQPVVVASIRDISEMMDQERRLTASSEALALAAERERIARDLHDNVLQYLFGLGMELQAIESIADEALARRLASGVDQIDRAIREIRTTVFTLGTTHPSGSFGHEMRDLIAQATRLLGFPPRVAIDGPADLLIPAYVRIEMLAALREALGNVARHAHASEAIVEIKVSQTELCVTIDDNGVGIDEARAASGNGLPNMLARARGLEGTFIIGRRPTGGTRVVWRVPVSD